MINKIIHAIFRIIAILAVIDIHEFSKAAVSTALGDKLPKNEGRLTLNPFKHFEPIGFVLLYANYNIGWGNPVRTSAMFYKNRKKDTIITYTMPILVSLVTGFLFLLVSSFDFQWIAFNIDFFSYIKALLEITADFSIIIAVCNIIPITPFCGERILSSLMPVDKSIRFTQNQSMMQMILLIALFFGIVSPVINFAAVWIKAVFQHIIGIFM